jgi:hypothetical protein
VNLLQFGFFVFDLRRREYMFKRILFILSIFIILSTSIGVAIAGTIQLPKTGQTTSYAVGDDGDIQSGVDWPYPRFSDNGDGAVTDELTGLMWTKDAGTPTVGACSGGIKTWQGALDYAACLNTSNYLGHHDWRLPNLNELISLVNAGQANSAVWLNTQGFTNTASYYWSSTTYAHGPGFAWYVGFCHGKVSHYCKHNNYGSMYVRCVRGGQSGSLGNSVISLPKTGQTKCYQGVSPYAEIPCAGTGQDGELLAGVAWPNPRFTNPDSTTPISGDIILDKLTGFEWTKDGNVPGPSACGPGTRKTWQGALDYAACLNTSNYLGHHDWRLPNLNELISLVNAGQANSTVWLNTQGFTNTASYYWSSTTYASYPNGAWCVYFFDGKVFYKSKDYSSLMYVRCLRGGTVNAQYQVSVTKSGTGSGTVTSSPTGITCGATCSASFDYNAVVTLTASASIGSTFAGWSGACTGTGTCQVTMNAARAVTAEFMLNTYALNVTKSGAGSGMITSSPAGISCGSTCSSSFNQSTVVTLTATPDVNSSFTGWSGGGCSGTGTCTVTMDAGKDVAASFAIKTYTITASAGAGGSVTCTPTTVNYNGSSTCTITPNTGYNVTDVTVAGVSVGAVTSYTINNVTANKTVAATFTIQGYPVRISGTPPTYFPLIQPAYDACTNGNVIETQSQGFSGDLFFNRNVSISIRGGYNADFTGNPSYTTINGKITISNGSVTFDKIIIK